MKDRIVHQHKKHDADYVDLRVLFRSLIEKKRLILIISFTIFALAMLYVLFKPTKYQASILLKIHHKQPNILGAITNPNQQLGMANMVEEPLSVQIALIQSEYILGPVIKSLGLDKKNNSKNNESEAIGKIRSNLTISDLSGSADNNANKVAIIRVSLTGYDPVLITNILNTLAKITQQQNIKLKTMEAEKTLFFLQKQLPVVQASLKESEAKLNQFRATSGRLDIKLQTQYLLNHLSDINKQIEKIRLKKINMLRIYTIYHPFVVSLNQELNELEKNRSELSDQLSKLPSSDQEALNLTREVNVKNNLYMLLLNQIHQLEVIKSGIMSDVQILSLATPSISKQVRLPVIGFFSLLIGFVLGCIGVIGWRMLIQRIDDPNWTEHVWNIKNLAIIPYSKKQAFNSAAFKLQQQVNLPILAYQSPNDTAIESLCGLRTFLQLTSENLHNNIIAIMGISDNVGKTFISVNLGSLLARIGNKVLVIDGNIRGGHMSRYFSTPSAPGLTDVVKGNIAIHDALIQSQYFENLNFLPVGTQSDISADLLMCDNFKSLLLDLSNKYQYVLINTPANMLNTDNFLIGSLAGVNLLVLGAYMHEAAEIDMVIKNFNHAGIKLSGCIYNNLRTNKKNNFHVQSQLASAQNKITSLQSHY